MTRQPARARSFLAAPLGLGLLFLALAATGAPGSDSRPRAAEKAFPAQLSRITSVRVYQGGKWVLPGESVAGVAAALAALEPSWLESLIRYRKGESPTAAEVAAWTSITGAVRATSPEAQFGVELNALEYKTPAQVEAMMAKVRAGLDNDGWMFDFYTSAYKLRPKVVEAAIADAHANDEWVGGNAFGIAGRPRVPPGSDFIAVQDFNFKIDLKAVRKLAKLLPVVFHLGNNPGLANSDGCEFIKDFSTKKRARYVSKRAGQQAKNHFRMSYPVLFPECARKVNAENSKVFAYNAIRDAPMLATIGALLDRYEPPATPRDLSVAGAPPLEAR